MSDIADLERGYRRWLRCYPKTFRREHETEILGVLMAGARDGRRQPALTECLDLMSSALWMRLRPRVPRSDRSLFAAVRLMYLGAMVELAVAISVFATIGNVKANIVRRDPGYTRAQWHAELTGKLDPLVVAAVIAVGFWLWIAWANGRGHSWAVIAFAIFFSLTTKSLLTGVIHGSAVYARADLVLGIVLWFIELAALVLVGHRAFRKITASRLDATCPALGRL
jgi:hypothetical protein